MLIGISGKKQSGKDTVCTIIQLIEHALYLASYDIEKMSKEHIIDEITEHLELKEPARYGLCPRRVAFAGRLKQCAAMILGETLETFESEEGKNSPNKLGLPDSDGSIMTNRKFLQLFGTEVGRQINKDIWVKSLIADHENSQLNGHRVDWIVTDVRFPNEADAIKEAGGVLIRVNKNSEVVDEHPSEIALDNYDKFDYIINNKGSLEDLVSIVYDIALRIL